MPRKLLRYSTSGARLYNNPTRDIAFRARSQGLAMIGVAPQLRGHGSRILVAEQWEARSVLAWLKTPAAKPKSYPGHYGHASRDQISQRVLVARRGDHAASFRSC